MVLERIRTALPDLSEAKQQVAAYILENWQEVAFLTVSQLGRQAGVSDSVVVRFAYDVGYSGYPELQEEIRGLVREELGLVDMYQRSVREDGSEVAQMVDQVLSNDISNLTHTLGVLLRPEDLEKGVDLITNARQIALLAMRSSAGPAQVMAIYLNAILGNTRFYSNAYGELYDQLRILDERDLVIATSFSWYTRHTISALEFCRERGVKAIAITDNHRSPLVSLADVSFFVRTDGVSFYLSQVATLGLVNVLLYFVAQQTKERSMPSLKEMQEVYARFYVPGGRKTNSAG